MTEEPILVPPPEPTDQPNQPSFDENEGLLDSLRRPRIYLSSVPTFVPKTFSEQIQFVDDGVTKSAYAYINGIWTQLGGGGVAGNDKDILFNDGGESGADDDFQWDKSSKRLIFNDDSDIRTANGSGSDDGKTLTILTGNGAGSGSGGDIEISGGRGGATGDGANISSIAGDAGNTSGNGGDNTVASGSGHGSGTLGGDLILSLGKSVDDGSVGRLKHNANNGETYRLVGQILTTDNTPTPTKIITAPSSNVIYFEAKVVAERTGGTSGSAGDAAVYVFNATYKRVGSGAPSLFNGINSVVSQEDQAGWNATFAISSNDIQLQVTGATNNNITWHFEVFYLTSSFGI